MSGRIWQTFAYCGPRRRASAAIVNTPLIPDSKIRWPHVWPTWIRRTNVGPTCLAIRNVFHVGLHKKKRNWAVYRWKQTRARDVQESTYNMYCCCFLPKLGRYQCSHIIHNRGSILFIGEIGFSICIKILQIPSSNLVTVFYTRIDACGRYIYGTQLLWSISIFFVRRWRWIRPTSIRVTHVQMGHCVVKCLRCVCN